MSADFAKIRSIFQQAVERSPDQWPAVLDAACAGDAELRRGVEELLEAHAHGGSVLDRGPLATIASMPEHAGTQIGPYKLIEQIGEGGMGTVWMAQQTEPVKRLVAVKLIKAGMDSRQVIARFDAERQALALMDHANIARVLDAGTTSAGRPYFVMDLVRGVPITRYCDEHHLTPRQRLELFIPVCQAIQHAHQKGIIHRDLKPSNVLVALYDGKPVPKVIDFGVAKAAGQPLTEQTLVTGFGAIVGTLEYMSPEQAEVNQLDIDTRSDIYSLGVLLYELLAGSPPFTRKELEKAGMLEMLRVIREQEPTKPSTKLSTAESLPTLAANRGTEPAKLTKLVRGELDWIVMKALEKDRSRRYETATGFAADIKHYLNDEPVVACPPSAAYRFRKFARRNKGGLAVAALVLLFLVLLGSSVGWAMRAHRAREADIARERSERQQRLTTQIDVTLAEANRLMGAQTWPEALAAARRAEAAVTGGEADAETAEMVRERLKDLEFIDRLEQIRVDVETTVQGETNYARGVRDYAGADREYARAFRDYDVDVDALPAETSVSRLKARGALAIPLAAALDDWVVARRRVSKADTASWSRLVAVARGIDPEPLRDWLRTTWGQPVTPKATEDLRQLAATIDVRAHHPATLVILAHTLQQVELSDRAILILREAQTVHPGDIWVNQVLGHALLEQKDLEGAIRFYTAAAALRPHSSAFKYNLGVVLRQSGNLDEAVAVYRKAIELSPNYYAANLNLAHALREQGKLDEAVAVNRKVVELYPDSYQAQHALGIALRAEGKRDEANAAVDKAIELGRKATASDGKNANSYHQLGLALRDRGNQDEAIDAYRKAMVIDPKSLVSHDLGNVLRAQGKLDEAIEVFRKGIEADPKNGPYLNLGGVLKEQGKLDEAITVYRKAIEAAPKNASNYTGLGQTLLHQKKVDEAIVTFRTAIELDPRSTQAAGPYLSLGNILRDQKNLPEAIYAYRKAIELDPKYGAAAAYINLGGVFRQQNKLDEAAQAFRKAIELDQPYATVAAYVALGQVLSQQNKVDEAIPVYRKIIGLEPNSPRTNNSLAWILATRPEAELRDPKQAVALAKRAVELKPEEGTYWTTLGVAHYRADDWKAAIAALEKSMELRKGGDSNSWFFLALAQWQLGDKDNAREWYDKAVEWMGANAKNNEELIRFRAEAEELMKR